MQAGEVRPLESHQTASQLNSPAADKIKTNRFLNVDRSPDGLSHVCWKGGCEGQKAGVLQTGPNLHKQTIIKPNNDLF